MNIKRYLRFYLLSLTGVTIASSYPIYMGILVIQEIQSSGAVPMESYPKYIIPYTPIAIALIFGVLLIPICHKICKLIDPHRKLSLNKID